MSEKLKKSLVLIISSLVIVFFAVFLGDFLVTGFLKVVEKVNSSNILKPLVLVIFALIVVFELYKYFQNKLQK